MFLRARLAARVLHDRTIHQRGGAAVPRAPPAGQLAAAGLVACDRVDGALLLPSSVPVTLAFGGQSLTNDLRYITVRFGALWELSRVFSLLIFIFFACYFHDFYYLCIFDIYGFNVTVSIFTMFPF